MLGSLITLASGVFTNLPSSARSSDCCCSALNASGNVAKMRPASEMSLVPTDTPAAEANFWMIGKKDADASSGASSTLV